MRPLNFKEWWDEVGTDNANELRDSLGITPSYFRMMRCGAKGIGLERAKAIVAWAQKHTPGFVPDLTKLLEGVPRSNSSRNRIQPSEAFQRAQAARQVSAGA